MNTFDRILVTAALPYANGPIHIGHLAGAYLPADLYCRYLRLKGKDVVFICGSDEHGVPIMLRARNEGVSPQEIADRYHAMIEEDFAGFKIAFDYYGRTSAQIHHETSQDFFRALDAKGIFTKKTESQLFDPEACLFLADRFVRGTCPNCGFEDAYGDQCENCGTALSPSELINPRSAITHATPVMKDTTHWYLPMGDLQPQLETWINSHPEWKPNVLGQVKSWFKDGLRDRSMTRDLPWGIEIPTDVAERAGVDAHGKVMYVWFDAPIGYISATKTWAEQQGDPDRWKAYWQDEKSRLIHFIGKDNIVFHCLIFPSMLMSHGQYVLPDQVPANEFLNIEGQKLSTSRNWAVWLQDYLADFPPDLLRYALATMLPETKDADFSWHDFQARVNSELADVLGNFVNRTLTFAARYFDGVVPPLSNPSALDLDVLAQLAGFPMKIGAAYEAFRLREAVFETMALARLGNKYFNDTAPWHTRKTDLEACGNTIHVSLQLCAALGMLLSPVMPDAAEKIQAMLNQTGVRSSAPGPKPGQGLGWDDVGNALLDAGHTLGTPEILFTKIEDAVIEAQVQKLGQLPSATPEPDALPYADLKDTITYDDFVKLDLRVAHVKDAERVPKTDKLLRLELDLGFEERQILAGIAQHVDPADLVGGRVVVVANLKPRKIRGLMSEGMVLSAEDREGRLVPVTAEIEPGSVVM